MLTQRVLTWLVLAIIAHGFVACSQTTPSGKGEESPLPENTKSDSFAKPTAHGTLILGLTRDAEFTDDARFHEWTFTLKEPASVTLRTKIYAQNLDTVLYLYKRAPGSSSWGAYYLRNDDDEGQVWSKIVAELDPAEYRVLVKTYKTSYRGEFSLVSSCVGSGCGQAVCPDEALRPAETNYGASCLSSLRQLLSVPVSRTDEQEILAGLDRCALRQIQRVALDYYKAHWQSMGLWEEMTAFGESKLGPHLSITSREYGTAGAIVAISVIDGDETTLTYVFDGAEQLQLVIWDQQSPEVYAYCKPAAEPSLPAPSGHCLQTLITFGSSSDSQWSISGSIVAASVSAEATWQLMLPAAAKQYLADTGVDATASLEYSGTVWESAIWGYGAQIQLQGPGDSPIKRYLVGTGPDSTTYTVIADVSDDTLTLPICSEIAFP